MLTFSAQHRIVNDIALSFQKNTKIHTKISETVLNRDLQFLNPKKYQSYTEANFKFIVLWTVFKNNTNKIDTLKTINQYTKDDIKQIMKEKERILFYEQTIQSDTEIMNTIIKTADNVFKMYKHEAISLMYVFKYFLNQESSGRIQKRQVQRINFFMSFFPKLEQIIRD